MTACSRILRMRALLYVALLVPAALYCGGANAAATFIINNLDGPGEGFNDPSPPDPLSTSGGNPGTTLGQQRLWAFGKAGEYWGQRMDSTVPIATDATMNPLTCNAGSAILGGAGPNFVVRDWLVGTPAPFPNTWYHEALGNSFAGQDIVPGSAEIGATFNSSIDNNNSCLFGTNWYYGLGAAPAGTISFFATVLHELAHGLGVSTFVNLQTGARFLSFDDVYMKHLEDHSTGKGWPVMTDPERVASAVDPGDLHWIGTNVKAASGDLVAGTVGDHVRMYAPNPLEGGSSVSHWDTAVQGSDELMEPFATGNEIVLVTDEMFQDEGWNAFEGDCAAPADDIVLQNQAVTVNQDACLTVTATPNVSVSSGFNVSFDAGRRITLGPNFNVELGASFAANVNPLKTLKQ